MSPRRSAASPANQSKLARFQRLVDGPFFSEVVTTIRAYLAAAVPAAPEGAGDRWVLTCLPSTERGRRLSAVSMRNMETLVLYAGPAAGGPSVVGFVIVRRGTALSGFGTCDAIRSAFDLIEVAESNYWAAGDDQLRVAGTAGSLRRALADPHIAEAGRELADFLATGTTVYARFHNPYLTEEVLRHVA